MRDDGLFFGDDCIFITNGETDPDGYINAVYSLHDTPQEAHAAARNTESMGLESWHKLIRTDNVAIYRVFKRVYSAGDEWGAVYYMTYEYYVYAPAATERETYGVGSRRTVYSRLKIPMTAEEIAILKDSLLP